MPLFTSQLVPPITTSNDWYSCRHYNVLLTTILHYNLHGHNTAAKITIAMPFSCVTHVTLSIRHYNAVASCGVAQYTDTRRRLLTANGRPRSFPQLVENPEHVRALLSFIEETGACVRPRATWEPG
jgi:hypothetical protein